MRTDWLTLTVLAIEVALAGVGVWLYLRSVRTAGWNGERATAAGMLAFAWVWILSTTAGLTWLPLLSWLLWIAVGGYFAVWLLGTRRDMARIRREMEELRARFEPPEPSEPDTDRP